MKTLEVWDGGDGDEDVTAACMVYFGISSYYKIRSLLQNGHMDGPFFTKWAKYYKIGRLLGPITLGLLQHVPI